jgi:hypothetical protein
VVLECAISGKRSQPFSLDQTRMEDLIPLSLQVSRYLAARIEVSAKRLGLSTEEYAQRAMEELEERLMQGRITELSHQLATHGAADTDTT